MLRKLIFWLHLCSGVVAGVVVLMMSLTGVVLTYERQMVAQQDSHAYFAEPQPGQNRLSMGALLAASPELGFTPDTVVVSANPAAPVILREGRAHTAHINPYSGAVYAPRTTGLDQFFASVRGWHRWFNVNGEGRANARIVTGTSNLLFLFLIVSGMYLWLPAVYRWSTMRVRLWFHPNARGGQARDFNWHHVFGFWSAIPLAVIVATATVFYYPWANNLVYRLAGEEPPQRGQAATPVLEVAAPQGGTVLPLETVLARVPEYAPQWRTVTITLPKADSALLELALDEGDGGQPQKRHTLRMDGYSGETLQWLPFSSQSAGRQARSWVRFLHTGEALGIIGQTVAGLVSFFAVLMVWTGLALSLRRFLRWRKRQSVRKAELVGVTD